MGWPLSQDYNEAIQNAATSFGDPDLRRGEVAVGALGLPIPRSGNFADVYQVRGPDGRRWAVKCFTRRVSDLRERYARIDAHLRQAALPFTVGFTFLPEGIRVRGEWYPVVKMEWVEGFTLNEFVRANLGKAAHLQAILRIWARLAGRLRDARVTHADLQHGNVLLVASSRASKLGIKLIDYDGMWLPALAGNPSGEVGHPAYQHPARIRDGLYSPDADRFPLLLVATALRGLIVGGPELWHRFDTGDNMLFREDDLRNPGGSLLMKVLWGFEDSVLTGLLGHLCVALGRPPAETPWLDHLLANGTVPALTVEHERAVASTLGVGGRSTTVQRRPSPARAEAGKVSEESNSNTTAIHPAWAPAASRKRWLPVAAAAAVAAVLVGVCIAVVARSGAGPTTRPSIQTVAAEPSEPKPEPRQEAPASDQTEPPRARTAARAVARSIGPDGPAVELRSIKGAGNGFAAVAFLASGRQAVAAEGSLVRLWDLALEKPLRTFQHPDEVLAVAVSADGRLLATSSRDKSVRVWSLERGETLHHFQRLDTVAPACAVAPDGSKVLAVTTGGAVREWDVSSGEERTSFQVPAGGCLSAAYSPDGERVAVGCRNGTAEVWDLTKHILVQAFDLHKGSVEVVRFAPDGRQVFSAGEDRVIRQWSVEGGSELHAFEGHAEKVVSLAVAGDGKLLVSGSADGGIIVWDVSSGRPVRVMQGPKRYGELRALALTPDGRRLLASRANGPMTLLRLARYENGKPVPDTARFAQVRQVPGGALPGCLRFLPDGTRFVTATGNRPELRWYSTENGELLGKSSTGGTPVQALSVSPAGDVLAVSASGSVTVWDGEKHTEKSRYESRLPFPAALAVAPDGHSVWAPGDDGMVFSIAADTGRPLTSARVHSDQRVVSVRFATDGEELVSIDEGGSIAVWTPKQAAVTRFPDSARVARAVELSPDRHSVLGYGSSDLMALYDATTGKPLQTFRGHTNLVLDATFTPDGKYVLSVGLDRTLRLWEVTGGKQLHVATLVDIGTNVCISPDGDHAITSAGTGESGVVQLWRLPRTEDGSE